MSAHAKPKRGKNPLAHADAAGGVDGSEIAFSQRNHYLGALGDLGNLEEEMDELGSADIRGNGKKKKGRRSVPAASGVSRKQQLERRQGQSSILIDFSPAAQNLSLYSDLVQYHQVNGGSVTKRRRVGSLSRRGPTSTSPSPSQDKVILSYPFAADASVFQDACSGMMELGDQIIAGRDAKGKNIWAAREDDDEMCVVVENVIRVTSNVPALKIRSSDLRRLESNSCDDLSESLVDFFMEWILRFEDPAKSNIHILSSDFFTYLDDEGPESVSSWTVMKDFDPFVHRFIMLPIREEQTWSLFVIVNPGAVGNEFLPDEEQSDEQDFPCILYLNPQSSHQKNKRLALKVRNWLNFEAERLKKFQNINTDNPKKGLFNLETMELLDPKIPYQDSQENARNSGMFICRYAYALYLMRDERVTYESAELFSEARTKYFRQQITRSDAFNFGLNEVRNLRCEFNSLLQKLSQSYKALELPMTSRPAKDFICPLSLDLPVDPVIAADDICYNRAAILDHIERASRTAPFTIKSPVTGKSMGPLLRPNEEVRNAIRTLIENGSVDASKADKWKAVDDMRLEAESGVASAMHDLGVWYHQGKHQLVRDEAKAYSWFAKGALKGCVKCLTMQGNFLYRGIGVRKNEIDGAIRLTEAATKGSDSAATVLGCEYYFGKRGIPKDLLRAEYWLKKAVEGECEVRHMSKEDKAKAQSTLNKIRDAEDSDGCLV